MELHPQLRLDTHSLGRLPFCDVLLHRNGSVPWIILVPRTECTDLLKLPADQRNQALTESALAGEVIQSHFGREKLNFAALGNVVPQLHLHVIGRQESDPCWPKAVWGNLTDHRDYSDDEVASAREAFQLAASRAGLEFVC